MDPNPLPPSFSYACGFRVCGFLPASLCVLMLFACAVVSALGPDCAGAAGGEQDKGRGGAEGMVSIRAVRCNHGRFTGWSRLKPHLPRVSMLNMMTS